MIFTDMNIDWNTGESETQVENIRWHRNRKTLRTKAPWILKIPPQSTERYLENTHPQKTEGCFIHRSSE